MSYFVIYEKYCQKLKEESEDFRGMTKKWKKQIPRQKMKRLIIFASLAMCFLVKDSDVFSKRENIQAVKAEENVQYTYDKLGRVITAVYSDGTKVTYFYDENGNITEVTKEKVSSSTTTSKTLAQDIKKYKAFKRKKGKIKSLSVIQKKKNGKKKKYMIIKISKICNRGTYGEIGYQIKYATNSKFKNAKNIKVKGAYTSKTIAVKKKKTYFVKVRGYMKTKANKTIYTKYSKVKKIKVK